MSGSSSWRDSRTYKLSHQLRDTSGRGGERHLSDLVGAGSVNFGKDGRKANGGLEADAPAFREKGWQDIRALMNGNRKRALETKMNEPDFKKQKSSHESEHHEEDSESPQDQVETSELEAKTTSTPQIFNSLNMYLNGSTALNIII